MQQRPTAHQLAIIDADPHDAYVRNGSYANTNFGSDAGLVLKNDGSLPTTVSSSCVVLMTTMEVTPVAAATLTLTSRWVFQGHVIFRLRLLDDADDGWKGG